MKDGETDFLQEKKVRLRNWKHDFIFPGENYYFNCTQLHKIVIPEDELTIILFWEYTKENNTPLIYSKAQINKEKSPCTGSNLYQPYNSFNDLVCMSLDAIRQQGV